MLYIKYTKNYEKAFSIIYTYAYVIIFSNYKISHSLHFFKKKGISFQNDKK